ncbi:ATP-binding cassette domain-containing protein [Candidatus Bathyarchaeota archaeon]|nr:ATP-binding cassette domain-containing protein [Candidatus Bathyarchaeota archaeon]
MSPSARSKGKPIIALRNVSLEREGMRLLDSIDWEVYPGEQWAIIGQNGAGKTLLLKIVATYLWPSRGKVEVLGKEFGKIALQRLRDKISWVSSALEEELPQDQPVIDVLFTGYFSTLRLFDKPTPQIIRRAKRLLKLMGLQGREGQVFRTLSAGEKRKVLVARAIMKKPRILILDEVCAGLDPVARKDYLESVQRLVRRERDITVLFVTHHLEEIFPGITHILGLKHGRVIFSGDKETQLNTRNITSLFGEGIELRKVNHTYHLVVQ